MTFDQNPSILIGDQIRLMMQQLPLFLPPSWTVTELTRYLRDLLENDGSLQDLWVTGEVSGCRRPSSGHLYFVLKDSTATLRCVMWRNSVSRQPLIPHDGEAVEVHGAISIYEADGQYQLYADTIRPRGEGLLFQEFLRLKARLEAEGLFDLARKRPIPECPQRIGIVTSPTGAALHDILNTLRRRYPLADVILSPTPVQGDEAPAGIVSALEKLNRVACPDVILLARGGGSMEDLWAFNDERVARAIAASRAPVISGVGHETDFTIADFVSDQRAPTPTAAAELATPDRLDLLAQLESVRQRMARAVQVILNAQRWEWNRMESRLRSKSPLNRVRSDRQRLDELARRMEFAAGHRQQLQRARLVGLEQRLAVLSPTAVLGRGYALVRHPDGRIVSSVQNVNQDDRLQVLVNDGTFGVRVTELPSDGEAGAAGEQL